MRGRPAHVRELAPLVDGARELYLQPPGPHVPQEHVAMIVAASRDLAAREAAAEPGPRGHRRRNLSFAAAALALAVTAAFVGTRPDDRPAQPQAPDRTVRLHPRFQGYPQPAREPDATPRRRPRAPERRSSAPPVPAPATPSPVEPAPDALAEVPPAPPEKRAQPEPRADAPPTPDRGYGGPDPEPAAPKGPLDTEPPIQVSP
jgi:hypothetical protein